MTITIKSGSLEQACKEIIETILFCLPNAFKGTVYRIGNPPTMSARRITSGVIDENRQKISWGLPARSDYNPPGKPWSEYMDAPGRPLEAMAWCVEKQKSWTAEDPNTDTRSVRLQVEGVWEDYHHMEPVLVRKEELSLGRSDATDYPLNSEDEVLWENSEMVVVSVIKIHFRANTIKIGSAETRIIKRLSRTLGTGLLSMMLREQSVEAMHELAQNKLDSCNILADSLRNTLAKSALIFSLIKLELGALRSSWEKEILKGRARGSMKQKAVAALDEILDVIAPDPGDPEEELSQLHGKFLRMSLPPGVGENWIRMRIEERWREYLQRYSPDGDVAECVQREIQRLKASLHLGKDPEIVAAHNGLPAELKTRWVDLLYRDMESVDLDSLGEITQLLANPELQLPGKNKVRKSLERLIALAQTMHHLESHTNSVLREVLNGNGGQLLPDPPNGARLPPDPVSS